MNDEERPAHRLSPICGLEPPAGFEPDPAIVGMLDGPTESAGELPAFDDGED